MNIEEYIFTINDLKYCRDLIKDRLLLIESIEYVTNIPSIRKEGTLYILSEIVHYYSNFEFSQVELEKQEVNKYDIPVEEIDVEEKKIVMNKIIK